MFVAPCASEKVNQFQFAGASIWVNRDSCYACCRPLCCCRCVCRRFFRRLLAVFIGKRFVFKLERMSMLMLSGASCVRHSTNLSKRLCPSIFSRTASLGILPYTIHPAGLKASSNTPLANAIRLSRQSLTRIFMTSMTCFKSLIWNHHCFYRRHKVSLNPYTQSRRFRASLFRS